MNQNPTIIDAWMQHPTAHFAKQPMFDSLRRWLGDGAIPAEIPLEITIAAMDAAGVDKSLICAWWGPQGPLISNEDVAGWVAAFPHRLIGIGAVNLLKPMEAVAEVRRCVNTYGFKGIRIVPWLWNLPPNDRRYYPVYAACAELGVAVGLQVGHTGPLCPSEPGRPIPYLDEVALDFPELTLVGGHIGYPWTNEMIALATKYPRVYIDTSAYKATRFPPELIAYMRGNGRKKVLFGTNYPMLTPQMALEGVAELSLDTQGMNDFLRDNAIRAYGLDAAPLEPTTQENQR